MSAYGTTVAKATNVTCLSPWGDDKTVVLPNVRVRDLFITAITSTTGLPVGNFVTDTIYESAVEQVHFQRVLDVSMATNNDIVTTAVKTMTLRLRYNHLMTDAALGMFSCKPQSMDTSTPKFSSQIMKGWLCPYLYSSHRWPAIPRKANPDVLYAHGPWIPGDYIIAQKLLDQSSLVIDLCPQRHFNPMQPPPRHPMISGRQYSSPLQSPSTGSQYLSPGPAYGLHHAKSDTDLLQSGAHPHRAQTMPVPIPYAHESHTDSAGLLSIPHPPPPHRMNTSPGQLQHSLVALAAQRRMVIVLLGIKPFRGTTWASSERPDESVLKYQLFNGCPAIVFPMRAGGPLIGWLATTLQGLHDAWYRDGGGLASTPGRARGNEVDAIANALFEFVDRCIDWRRVNAGDGAHHGHGEGEDEEVNIVSKRLAVARALELLVVAAAQSDSRELRKKVDRARAGIAFFRLP
ncbi:hypothetical protein BKA62DRAFT_627569 [Auriculariales sp. MPI-PUGE-AT-0066]|nr:hypothetical protein BKA62DRAFT_627569 [Auriculariales sp. MPI-PUGE-AT-0066]